MIISKVGRRIVELFQSNEILKEKEFENMTTSLKKIEIASKGGAKNQR